MHTREMYPPHSLPHRLSFCLEKQLSIDFYFAKKKNSKKINTRLATDILTTPIFTHITVILDVHSWLVLDQFSDYVDPKNIK